MNHRIAVVFAGGGAHYIGMGQTFYEQYPVYRNTLDEASDILYTDLKKICFEGDLETLSSMEYSQVAIFTAGVGMYRVFQSLYGSIPSLMAGHSLGEYCALTCSNVLSFKDGLLAIQKRGKLLHQSGVRNNGRMMAVSGLDLNSCTQIVRSLQSSGLAVYISNYNSPRQFVLSGNESGIYEAAGSMKEAGADVHILQIPTCSHSQLMNDARIEFDAFLAGLTFNEMSIPVYANITGSLYKNHHEAKASLGNHLVQPVRWQAIIEDIIHRGTDLIVEMGPQAILKTLNHYIDDSVPILAMDDNGDRTLLHDYFNKSRVASLHHFVDRCITESICYPNHAADSDVDGARIKELLNRLSTIRESIEKDPSIMRNLTDECLQTVSEIHAYKGADAQSIKAVVADLTNTNKDSGEFEF